MFNKDLWQGISGLIGISSYPILPCPYCNGKSLALDQTSLSIRKLSGSALKSYTDKFHFQTIKELDDDENTWIKILYGLGDLADSLMYEPSQFIAFF